MIAIEKNAPDHGDTSKNGRGHHLTVAAAAVLMLGILGSCNASKRSVPDGARERELRGAMSFFLLSSHLSDRIVIEIDYVDGQKPGDEPLQELARQAEIWTGKPVRIDLDDEIPLATWERIAPLAADRRGEALSPWLDADRTAWRDRYETIYVVYVPGEYPVQALQVDLAVPAVGGGMARVPTIFVHRDELKREAALWIGVEKIERFILVHELGHVLGLVGSRHHAAEGDPDHCNRPTCVMASPTRRSRLRDAAQALVGRVPADFGPDCVADLQDARRWFADARPDEVSRRSRARNALRATRIEPQKAKSPDPDPGSR